jgi:adenylate cyclase
LTGNARREDGRLIVTATLYQTADERQVWSQRYDRPDRPNEWNGIVRNIYVHFAQATVDAEAARAMREHPESLDKRDLMLAATRSSFSLLSKESMLQQIALLERALALDPDYLEALREVAQVRANLVLSGFSADPAADLTNATKAVDRALLRAPNDMLTLRAKETVLRAQGDLDGAAGLLRRLIALDPLWAYRYRELGIILLTQGHYREALDNFLTAKPLVTDVDPIAPVDASIATGLLANDRFPEAITQARLAIAEYSSESGRANEFPWLTLIAAESENGQHAAARADLQKFLAVPRTWHTMTEIQKFDYFAANPKLLEGLRQAGMPEE